MTRSSRSVDRVPGRSHVGCRTGSGPWDEGFSEGPSPVRGVTGLEGPRVQGPECESPETSQVSLDYNYGFFFKLRTKRFESGVPVDILVPDFVTPGP